MHVCPTGAIRVRGRKARLQHNRCINCGECVHACPNGAVIPQTSSFNDFSGFKHTIAVPSPVLYAQFGKETSPSSILRALTKIGFDDACDVAAESEAVSIAIQEYLDSVESPRPLISPFCPAVVRLMQIRYPNLLDHLIPIEAPMSIAAREAKRKAMQNLGLRENEVGVIYIAPCPAKMVAVKDPQRKRHAHLNGTIAIAEIYPSLLRALQEVQVESEQEQIRGLGLGWPALGGQVACLKAEDCLAIGGVADAVRIFEEIENGKLRDIQYVEVHSCPTGCVGGALTVENAYIARGRVLQMIHKYGGTPSRDRGTVTELYRKDFFAFSGKIPPLPFQPLDGEVSRAIQKLQQKQRLYEHLPKINCGACGAPTCSAFAEDVVKGEASAEDCVFVTLKHFEKLSAALLDKVRKQSKNICETEMEGV